MAGSGQVAVIFRSFRTNADADGYAAAAAAMEALVARQPGHIAVHGVRGPDGEGITISYWIDEASARAWHDHPEHRAIREAGRGRWYAGYEVIVAQVTRSYGWRAP